MSYKLYPAFEHWYRGGQILFYSDPHFGDENNKKMLIAAGQEYITDEEKVLRINSCLQTKDTIVFLGDIGDVEYIKKIKGYKILILGNHDKGALYYKPYFDEVYEGAVIINSKIILSHEPVDFKYALNIHGHDHSDWYCDKTQSVRINVCAEKLNYYPKPLKEVLKSGLLKSVTDIHREVIDKR